MSLNKNKANINPPKSSVSNESMISSDTQEKFSQINVSQLISSRIKLIIGQILKSNQILDIIFSSSIWSTKDKLTKYMQQPPPKHGLIKQNQNKLFYQQIDQFAFDVLAFNGYIYIYKYIWFY